MHSWKVSLINQILNFRKIVVVSADSYTHAIDEAKRDLAKRGYDKIEYCISI